MGSRQIIHEAQYHYMRYKNCFILAFIAIMQLAFWHERMLHVQLLFGFILLCLAGIKAIIIHGGRKFYILNQSILIQYGILRKSIHEIPFSKCVSVYIEQSLLGKILNYGDLYINMDASINYRYNKISQPQIISQIISQGIANGQQTFME